MAKPQTFWVGSPPTHCQISGRPIIDKFVDGAVPGVGSWAFMHPEVFKEMGGTYGVGQGQLYEKQVPSFRWLKIEG